MKKILLLAVLTLALPTALIADSSVDYTNNGGTLSGSTAGLTLSGSVLIAVNGLNGGGLLTGSNLGSVSFTTGALVSGSLKMGGIFAGGGSFTITGNGDNGVPDGTLFTGSFSGPVTWTMVTLSNGTHDYTLTGSVSGWTGTGAPAQAATVQLTVNTGKGMFKGKTRIVSGETNSVAATEPGSLSLLGTALIGLAGLVHHKFNN